MQAKKVRHRVLYCSPTCLNHMMKVARHAICAPREDPPLPEGTLQVSFIFFSDGFVSRQGRNASSGGVYMSYASCLFRSRTSRHAVRRLSVAPAGVDSDAVLVARTDGLVQGATSTWPVTDPDGRPLRVFADVAFYVGDYMQVSHTSHRRGHGARAPCPLYPIRLFGGNLHVTPAATRPTSDDRIVSQCFQFFTREQRLWGLLLDSNCNKRLQIPRLFFNVYTEQVHQHKAKPTQCRHHKNSARRRRVLLPRPIPPPCSPTRASYRTSTHRHHANPNEQPRQYRPTPVSRWRLGGGRGS